MANDPKDWQDWQSLLMTVRADVERQQKGIDVAVADVGGGPQLPHAKATPFERLEYVDPRTEVLEADGDPELRARKDL